MRRIIILLIVILLSSCVPYGPQTPEPLRGYVSIFNKTEKTVFYRIYEDGAEVPDFALFEEKSIEKNWKLIPPDTPMHMDVILVTGEKTIIGDSLVYKAREIIAQTSFVFEVENRQHIDLTLTYEDGVINHTITER